MEKAAIATSNPLRLPRGLEALVALCVLSALALGYYETLTPVTLVVDGQQWQLRTHQDTIGALLMDAGFALHEKDNVELNDEQIAAEALHTTTLEPNSRVTVKRSLPVHISADGYNIIFHTHATSVERILTEARISLGPYDEVEVEGELLSANRSAGHARLSCATVELKPVRIIVRRAVPFTLHEDDQVTTLHTTAPTVGEALRRAGLTLYLADGVQPGLGERMLAGLHVYVDRSIPLAVQVDGRTIRTRTHRERVDKVLADLHVVLTGQDHTTPTLDAPVQEDATVRVVRVSERFLIEQEPIPFDVVWQPDQDLEIDHQRLLQEGARGILERRIRIRYEDGREVARKVENEYVAVPPTTKINGYGTKIIVRTLDTPSGPIEYWRTIRMLATSYSASTAGTPRSAPWYGRTATGMTMRYGIVAVDPQVINLHTQVYVPVYGIGYAGDTGGAIRGRRIDLGYDDDNLVLWYRWVDVYLLVPVPDRINYVIGP
jgi:uncharacterized protein YabE (DUF348 family)